MIELKQVCFAYTGGGPGVHDISLQIPDGEFLALTGANGAGKSTLSRLIRGLLRPDSGQILLDGADLSRKKASSLAGQIGFLFQNPDRQLCKNTVREELAFSLSAAGIDGKTHKERMEAILSDFSLQPDSSPFQLSRGERQRLALASVLVCEPKILILDEPTTGLDYAECTHIMQLVRTRHQSGVTILMVSHDMELVLDYADRVALMNQGELIATGTPREVFYRQELLQRAHLLPPQIPELSLALGERFGQVTTAAELADAIAASKGGAQ